MISTPSLNLRSTKFFPASPSQWQMSERMQTLTGGDSFRPTTSWKTWLSGTCFKGLTCVCVYCVWKWWQWQINIYVFVNSSPEYDESVSDLISILHSVSGLQKVDLNFRFMTVDGASRVLDLIQMNPSLKTLRWDNSVHCFVY